MKKEILAYIRENVAVRPSDLERDLGSAAGPYTIELLKEGKLRACKDWKLRVRKAK